MKALRSVALSFLAPSFLLYSHCSDDFTSFDGASECLTAEEDLFGSSGKMHHGHKMAEGVTFLSPDRLGVPGRQSSTQIRRATTLKTARFS